MKYGQRTSVRASEYIKRILNDRPTKKESRRVRRLAEERMYRKHGLSLVFIKRELENSRIVDGW